MRGSRSLAAPRLAVRTQCGTMPPDGSQPAHAAPATRRAQRGGARPRAHRKSSTRAAHVPVPHVRTRRGECAARVVAACKRCRAKPGRDRGWRACRACGRLRTRQRRCARDGHRRLIKAGRAGLVRARRIQRRPDRRARRRADRYHARGHTQARRRIRVAARRPPCRRAERQRRALLFRRRRVHDGRRRPRLRASAPAARCGRQGARRGSADLQQLHAGAATSRPHVGVAVDRLARAWRNVVAVRAAPRQCLRRRAWRRSRRDQRRDRGVAARGVAGGPLLAIRGVRPALSHPRRQRPPGHAPRGEAWRSDRDPQPPHEAVAARGWTLPPRRDARCGRAARSSPIA